MGVLFFLPTSSAWAPPAIAGETTTALAWSIQDTVDPFYLFAMPPAVVGNLDSKIRLVRAARDGALGQITLMLRQAAVVEIVA